MIRFEAVRSGSISQSFTVAPGSVCKVLANSEDVKNLFVAILLGRKRPESGQVILFDSDIYALGERARIDVFRRAGVVTEEGGLISNLKVWENILLPAAYHHNKTADDIESEVNAFFAGLGYQGQRLRRLMARLPDELTTYEKRITATARAMLMEPAILVYDFALTGLGREEAAGLLAATRRIHVQRPDRVSVHVCPDDGLSARIPADQSIHLEE